MGLKKIATRKKYWDAFKDQQHEENLQKRRPKGVYNK